MDFYLTASERQIKTHFPDSAKFIEKCETQCKTAFDSQLLYNNKDYSHFSNINNPLFGWFDHISSLVTRMIGTKLNKNIELDDMLQDHLSDINNKKNFAVAKDALSSAPVPEEFKTQIERLRYIYIRLYFVNKIKEKSQVASQQ